MSTRYYEYNEKAFRPSNYSNNTRVKNPTDQVVVSKRGPAPEGYYMAGTQTVSNKAGDTTYNIFRPLNINQNDDDEDTNNNDEDTNDGTTGPVDPIGPVTGGDSGGSGGGSSGPSLQDLIDTIANMSAPTINIRPPPVYEPPPSFAAVGQAASANPGVRIRRSRSRAQGTNTLGTNFFKRGTRNTLRISGLNV